VRPALLGLVVVVLGLMMLVAGTLGSEMFLSRSSLIAVTAGSVLFLGGWARLRVLFFPLAFLLLMVPLPAFTMPRRSAITPRPRRRGR